MSIIEPRRLMQCSCADIEIVQCRMLTSDIDIGIELTFVTLYLEHVILHEA